MNDILWQLARAGCGGRTTTCTVTATASPAGYGEVTGGGTVTCGGARYLQARAFYGYQFSGWMEGGQIISTSPTLTVTATTNRNIVGVFVPIATGTTPPPVPAPSPTPTPTPSDPGGTFFTHICPRCSATLRARDNGFALWSTLECPNCLNNITIWGKNVPDLQVVSTPPAVTDYSERVITCPKDKTVVRYGWTGAKNATHTLKCPTCDQVLVTFTGVTRPVLLDYTPAPTPTTPPPLTTPPPTSTPTPSPYITPGPTPTSLPVGPVTPTPQPGPVIPAGLSTGTLVALGIGAAAIIGGGLWFMLRKQK